MSRARTIEGLVAGQPTTDGAGVRLVRLLTQDLQRRLDPFLMLDAFATDNPDDYIAGFPEHPHRGFETITYMLNGNMRHRDSRGNEGLLGPGAVQWMTAGRGILHSEMPEQIDGRMEGFQLWLNLPSQDKMTDPAYADIGAHEIPVVSPLDGVTVKLIAGNLDLLEPHNALQPDGGFAGAVTRPHTEPMFFDFKFAQAAQLRFAVPAGHNGFVYAIAGQLAISDKVVPLSNMAIVSDGDSLTLAGQAGTHAIVVAGKPLHEPIAQYGPFVMNTREEIMQAMQDMRAGTLAGD